MEELNKLELAVLHSLVKQYPSLKEHIPYLKVRDREITGVGMYVSFIYSEFEDVIKNIEIISASLSTDENIEIEGLEFGLGFEVDITDGKINFIEFINYGEDWDGSFTEFNIVKDI